MALTETLAAIGDAIRRKTGNREPIPLEKMPEVIDNIPTVALKLQEKLVTENGRVTPDFWSNGLSAVQVAVDTEMPYNDGVADGVKQGKKLEYDTFWDRFQDRGARTTYSYAFGTRGWTDENFKPKYDIVAVGSATSLFRYLEVTEDLPVIFERQGIVLDTSQATNLEYCCQTLNALVPIRLGTFDCTGLTVRLTSSFSCAAIKQLKVIINETVVFYNTFNNATALTDFELEGILGTNGLSLQNSKLLTHDSLMSVINALKDYSSSSTAYTVAFGDENLAKLTEEEIAMATEKGWTLS